MGLELQKIGSIPSVRRLPTYLHLLRYFHESGREIVSSTHIAEKLKLEPIQVRKDLAITGCEGKPKVGYYIPALITAIEMFLGWNSTTEAFLVGTGNLGSALLGYAGFKWHGLSIVAAFDSDPEKIGTTVMGHEIAPIEKLADLALRIRVSLGIITVPADAAQAVADAMVEGGIQAIWNFAPVTLHVPDDIVVQNEELASGLAVLSVKVRSARNSEIPVADDLTTIGG